MTHPVYLYYKNRDLQDESFRFNIQIPFLWQEMYDLELIENQRYEVSNGLNQKENNSASQLIIPIEKAIQNIEKKSKSFTSEKDDKKKLRIEFLNFLKNNVAIGTDLQINFFELKEMYQSTEDLVDELKSFHLDRKKELRHQREPVSLRAIGYNENFEAHSTVYQFLLEEERKYSSINSERHKKALKSRNSPQTKAASLEKIFLWLIIIGSFVIGFLLMILSGNYLLGTLIIIVGFMAYFFNRTRIKFNNQS